MVRLVDRLKAEGVVRHQKVMDVMKEVDRANYIDFDPYWDSPQGIACGQTISAPHMHGFALEEMLPSLLKSPRESLKILDVGCGKRETYFVSLVQVLCVCCFCLLALIKPTWKMFYTSTYY